MIKQLINIKVIFLSVFLFWCQSNTPAKALIDVPTFRFAMGHTFLSFTAGTLFAEPTSLNSTLTLNPMFLWDVPMVRSRIGLHFIADIGSDYGSLPNSGIGISALFYPLGLSSSREVKEDRTFVVKSRISPFVQLQITPVKSSISDATTASTPTNQNYFSALVIETSAGAGIDYPFSEDMIGFIGGHYRFAAFTSEETTIGAIHYSGIEFLIGIMTNFY